MKRFAVTAVAGVVAATAPPSGRVEEGTAPPQSAREVRGATPYAAIKNRLPPKLILAPLLPDLLDKGIIWIQYHTENVRIVPVFGEGSPGRIPAGRPPARPRRRPALVVGRRERPQHRRHCLDAARRAQGADRACGRQPPGLSWTGR